MLYPFNYENRYIFILLIIQEIVNEKREYLIIVKPNIPASYSGMKLFRILKLYITLHPDLSFKPASNLWFTDEILFIDADIKKNIL